MKVFNKRICLLHTLAFLLVSLMRRTPRTERMVEAQDGKSLGQCIREILVNQEDTLTVTLVTEGLFVTAADIILKMGMNRIWMNRICLLRYCHSHSCFIGEETLFWSFLNCQRTMLLVCFSDLSSLTLHWLIIFPTAGLPNTLDIFPTRGLHICYSLFLDCSTPMSSRFVFFLFMESYCKHPTL